MNIIFLDVDGVLNSRNKLISVYNETHKAHSGYNYPFDEKCLENLRLLVDLTNSKLVITSTWRMDDTGISTLLNVLKSYNLDKEVIGYTPIIGSQRELEIKQFLSTYEKTPNFIVLDDKSNFNELLPYLVKTNSQTGLTIDDVENAVKKLTLKKRL